MKTSFVRKVKLKTAQIKLNRKGYYDFISYSRRISVFVVEVIHLTV